MLYGTFMCGLLFLSFLIHQLFDMFCTNKEFSHPNPKVDRYLEHLRLKRFIAWQAVVTVVSIVLILAIGLYQKQSTDQEFKASIRAFQEQPNTQNAEKAIELSTLGIRALIHEGSDHIKQFQFPLMIVAALFLAFLLLSSFGGSLEYLQQFVTSPKPHNPIVGELFRSLPPEEQASFQESTQADDWIQRFFQLFERERPPFQPKFFLTACLYAASFALTTVNLLLLYCGFHVVKDTWLIVMTSISLLYHCFYIIYRS